MNAKESLENIYHEGMIKYEQICEELLEKVPDEEALKFQEILDEAQKIFESPETSVLQKNKSCMTIKEITRAKTFIHAYMHPLDNGEHEQTKRKYRDTAIICMENEIKRLANTFDAVGDEHCLEVGAKVTVNGVSYTVKAADFNCIVLEHTDGSILELR